MVFPVRPIMKKVSHFVGLFLEVSQDVCVFVGLATDTHTCNVVCGYFAGLSVGDLCIK